MHSRRIDLLVYLTCALASSAWCVSAARTLGATFDEPTYLQNGLHFWRTGSHRTLMRLGTMPLPMDLQTLPLAVAEHWNGVPWDLESDFSTILPWMRHGNLVFWWLLLGYGFLIARDVAGPWAGRIAVAALACEPNLLAHASLATTDIAVSAAVLMTIFHFRRGRAENWLWRVGVPGVCYGIALLCKASALVFVPICMATVEALDAWHSADGEWKDRAVRFLKDAFSIGLIGFAVAVAGCGSDFEAEPSFIRWANELPNNSWKPPMVWIAHHLRIFGNAGECLVMQVKHNMRGHGQFLLGEYSKQPFWYYFPVVFAIKLTLPTLVGLLLATVFGVRRLAQNWPLVCGLLLLAFSFSCRVQIGIRLQLCCVTLLLIGLAVSAARWQALARVPVLAGIAWMAIAVISAWPNGLCYANEVAARIGPADRLVSDSNFDWGQGLPELAAWNENRGRLPLDVWYYGRDPMLKKLPVRDLPLHCVTLHSPEDMQRFCWGRYLAVAASIQHGYVLTDAHRNALKFLETRKPVARTTTFYIYDFTDLGPPPAVAEARP